MMKTNNASSESVADLRRRLREALPRRGDALLNTIDAIAAGPRASAPIELVASPLFGFAFSSLYSSLRSAEELTDARLRLARLGWLAQWGDQQREPEAGLGPWHVRILDATNACRPRTRTVEVGFAHGADGMRPGHALSILSEPVAAGSWCLPVEIALIPCDQTPREFGADHVVGFIEDHGWTAEDVLALDADYTNAPTLRPMVEAGANVIGRVSARRVFYLPPPPYAGWGRPRVRGRKITLSDARTLPEPCAHERVEREDGRRFEISRFDDVRMRQWPSQPITLYRIWEYRADGRRRFQRPLWLIYVGSSAAPAPAHGQAIYERRFSIEHSLRFLKGELGLARAQFFGPGAEPRFQVWVELVASAFWLLWALRPLARERGTKWPSWWRGRTLTPGAMRRLAVGLFAVSGITAPKPTARGKSPGRATGTTLEPKRRYRIYRRPKRRRAA